MSADTTEITDAESPFNDPEADVFLRSSRSGVDFRVFKSFLSFASPMFKAMFTLPQGQGSMDDTKDGLPIVPVDEDSVTLDALLRYCYPMCAVLPPALEEFEQVIAVLEASIKYGMEGVERRVRENLIAPRFLDKEPLRIFAIAVQHRLEPEARMAAKKTLGLPILGRQYIKELEYITGGVHHRLQEYHVECGKLASVLATNVEWITRESSVWFECNDCKNQRNVSACVTISGNRRKWVVSKWWVEYMGKAATALLDRPSGVTATCPELMDEALGKASLCPNCRTKAFAEMREFGEAFAVEIERVTSEVVLDIKL